MLKPISKQEGGVLALWLFMGIMAVVSSLVTTRSVSDVYFQAAMNWIQGHNLYNRQGIGFIYLPQSAILCTPFALLPHGFREALWRLVNWAVLYCGFRCWLQAYCAKYDKPFVKSFFLFSLFFIPIAFSSLRNGQMNMVLISGALWFFYCLEQRYFKWAAFLVVGSFFLKTTMLPFLLLTFCLYPQIRKPVLGWVVFFLVLPFCTQFHWGYVLKQYHAAFYSLYASSHLGSTVTAEWAQIFNTILVFTGHDVAPQTQNIIRLLMAIVVLAQVLLLRQVKGSFLGYFLVFSLFATYLMMFNPRTENNDYIVLAACFALAAVACWHRQAWLSVGLVGVLSAGTLWGSNIALAFTPSDQSWVTPLCALVAYIGVSLVALKQRTSSKVTS